MELSSMDVERKKFAVVRRGGFDRTEVEEYLRRVTNALSRLESELSTSQRHSNELMRQLGVAQAKAEEGSKSFLHAAEMKQKLLAEAEGRAREILEAAHAERGTADPVGAASADLMLVRGRFEGEPDWEASVDPTVDLSAARAEAAQILEDARSEASEIIRRAEDEAEQTMNDARQALAAVEDGGGPAAEAVTANALKLKEEADRAIVAARDEREKANAMRVRAAEEAERVIAEATAMQDEARASRATSVEVAESVRGDRERADEMLQRAESRRLEAERALAKAEAKMEASDAEAKSILETAASEAARTRSEARSEADRVLKSAEERARQLDEASVAQHERRVASSKREASQVLEEARSKAAALTTSSRERHEKTLARLKDVASTIEEIRQAAPHAAEDPAEEHRVVVMLDDARHTMHDIDAEVWLADERDDEETRSMKSRYARRSAGLPHLGDEKSSSVLSDLDSLRRDDKAKRRKAQK